LASGVAYFPGHVFLSRSLLQWVNADELTPTTLVFELYDAINQSEKGVVLAPANIGAWLPFGTSLPGNDVAAENSFAPKFLQA
jgi:hypothetical protein